MGIRGRARVRRLRPEASGDEIDLLRHRAEIEPPAQTKGMRAQNVLAPRIPEFIPHPLDGGRTEVVGDESQHLPMPGSVSGRLLQFLYHSGDHESDADEG